VEKKNYNKTKKVISLLTYSSCSPKIYASHISSIVFTKCEQLLYNIKEENRMKERKLKIKKEKKPKKMKIKGFKTFESKNKKIDWMK